MTFPSLYLCQGAQEAPVLTQGTALPQLAAGWVSRALECWAHLTPPPITWLRELPEIIGQGRPWPRSQAPLSHLTPQPQN